MQRRLIVRATDIHIWPVNEEKAIQAAADLLGELLNFLVAGGAIIFEVHRSGMSEARIEETRKKELEEIMKKMEELEREMLMMNLRVAVVEPVTVGEGGHGFFQGLSLPACPGRARASSSAIDGCLAATANANARCRLLL